MVGMEFIFISDMSSKQVVWDLMMQLFSSSFFFIVLPSLNIMLTVCADHDDQPRSSSILVYHSVSWVFVLSNLIITLALDVHNFI